MADSRIDEIVDFVSRIAAGDTRASLEGAGSGDSLDELIEALNHLAGAISSQTAEFEAAERRIEAELRLAEERLRRSEALYQDLYDNAPDMFLSVDAETIRIVQCNQTLCRALGYVKEELIGKPVYEIYHPESPDDLRRAFRSFATTGEVLNAELRLKCKDGGSIDVSVHTSAARDERGIISYSRTVLRDISDLKRAERNHRLAEHALEAKASELERSNAELEQFAHVASHDLQEPLRMVASFTKMLDTKYGSNLDEEGRKYIAYAVEGAERMQRLIKELLAFSRVGTRGKPFDRVDLAVAAQEALANLKVAIDEVNAEVTVGDLPSVYGDHTQLVQVFQNLISNAIKFRQPDERLTVQLSATRRSGEWEFSITDNGIGLDMKFAGRVFEIFQQLHHRDEYSGSGMGLAIAKKIVQRHGGTIWVAASAPNEGTRVSFTIADPER